MKAVENADTFSPVKLTKNVTYDRSTVVSECERKMALHHNQRKVNLISNVLFVVKCTQQDINYKNTKMNKITNWEEVDQNRNNQ